MSTAYAAQQQTSPAAGSWWKRIGLAGFVFFFAKGCLWLIAPAAVFLVR